MRHRTDAAGRAGRRTDQSAESAHDQEDAPMTTTDDTDPADGAQTDSRYVAVGTPDGHLLVDMETPTAWIETDAAVELGEVR